MRARVRPVAILRLAPSLAQRRAAACGLPPRRRLSAAAAFAAFSGDLSALRMVAQPQPRPLGGGGGRALSMVTAPRHVHTTTKAPASIGVPVDLPVSKTEKPVAEQFDAAAALNTTAKTAEGAAVLYDAWAVTYDQTLTDWGYEAPAKTAQLLKEHLPPHFSAPEHVPVLDCGCGTGLSSTALAANGFPALIGVDVSTESLDLAARKGLHLQLERCELDTEPLPFHDNAFSAVSCVGVTSYLSTFDFVFGEWIRTTRPGGMCAFTSRTWDADTNGICSSAEKLEEEGKWKQVLVSEPSPYMPKNPVPEESAKRIRYVLYEVL